MDSGGRERGSSAEDSLASWVAQRLSSALFMPLCRKLPVEKELLIVPENIIANEIRRNTSRKNFFFIFS